MPTSVISRRARGVSSGELPDVTLLHLGLFRLHLDKFHEGVKDEAHVADVGEAGNSGPEHDGKRGGKAWDGVGWCGVVWGGVVCGVVWGGVA